MTLEGAAERAGRWWRRRTPGERVAFGAAGLAAAIVAVALVLVFELQGPILLIGALATAGLWKRKPAVWARLGGLFATSGDPAGDERERRRALIAKYGHVPLAELAASQAPLMETTPPEAPAPSPEELERTRRGALTAKYGHVPLTELADPRHIGSYPLAADPFSSGRTGLKAAPRTEAQPTPVFAPVPTPQPKRSGQEHRGRLNPAPSSPPGGGKPIVESGRRSWGRRPSRPGSIVE